MSNCTVFKDSVEYEAIGFREVLCGSVVDADPQKSLMGKVPSMVCLAE
jgi:hypothetical protein